MHVLVPCAVNVTLAGYVAGLDGGTSEIISEYFTWLDCVDQDFWKQGLGGTRGKLSSTTMTRRFMRRRLELPPLPPLVLPLVPPCPLSPLSPSSLSLGPFLGPQYSLVPISEPCPAYQFQTAPQTKGYQNSLERKKEKNIITLYLLANHNAKMVW